MKLQDYKEQWENLETKRNLKGKEALAAVKQDGYALRFVSEQTEEICLAAVQKDGYALQFVSEQTEKICLAAVHENGNALEFVSETIMQSLQADEIEIDGKKFSKSTIKEALKNYINN
jgi:ribosomal protein L24E